MNDAGSTARGAQPAAVPSSLLEGDLPDLWTDVAERLERNGDSWRGTIRLSGYSSHAGHVLTALVGRPGRRTVDVAEVERALVRLGVGEDLVSALAALGRPISPAPAARRAERARVADGRAAARERAADWPEPWATEWVDDLIRAGLLAGLGRDEAIGVLSDVRRVLDAIEGTDGAAFSRTDLAATVLGSAHALDDGTLLERATARALRLSQAGDGTDGVDPWATIGAYRNLLAGAALTWRLPLVGGHPLAPVVQRCSELGLPFVLTRLAIDAVGVTCVVGSDVLVVENPRVIEYAAQIGAAQAVVCANGNPSTTVTELVAMLAGSGAQLRYHGDFDAAGLEICGRMHARGLAPWRMGAQDYLDALQVAEEAGVPLPVDHRACGPTPWDPALRDVFEEHRRIVHEERLLDDLLPHA